MDAEISASDLGKLMNQIRLGGGLTLKQMAERTGVSAATLCRLEEGKIQHLRGPTRDALYRALRISKESKRPLLRLRPMAEEAVLACVEGIDCFTPKSEAEAWPLVVCMWYHYDPQVREAAAKAIRRAVHSGLEPCSPQKMMVGAGVFDPDEKVRAVAEAIHTYMYETYPHRASNLQVHVPRQLEETAPRPEVVPGEITLETLRKLIRQFRLGRYWTLKQMAERTGVSAATLCRLERGQTKCLRGPTRDALYRILGIPSRSDPLPLPFLNPMAGEAVLACVEGIDCFTPKSEAEAWPLVVCMWYSDPRIREAAAKAIRRAVHSGLEPCSPQKMMVGAGVFDPDEKVRAVAEAIHKYVFGGAKPLSVLPEDSEDGGDEYGVLEQLD